MLPECALDAVGKPSRCRKALRAKSSRKFCQPINLAPAPRCASGYNQSLDDPSGFNRAAEYRKTAGTQQRAEVCQLQSEPQVRPVAPIPGHRVGIRDPGKWLAQDALRGVSLNAFDEKRLDGSGDICLVNKCHLEIKLGELGLPVGPRVLIAEATGHLKVPIHASHHQKLLELLGCLGKGIELAGMKTCRNQEVPGTLRGTRGQDRRLDL